MHSIDKYSTICYYATRYQKTYKERRLAVEEPKRKKGGIAAFALIDVGDPSETRVVIVCDEGKCYPHLFKCPGGTGEEGETPEQTVIREVMEEVIKKGGRVEIKPEHLSLLLELPREDHTIFFYTIRSGIITRDDLGMGQEIRELRTPQPTEIQGMIENNQILQNHATALQVYLSECAVPF